MWEIIKFLLAVGAFCVLVSLVCAVYMIYCPNFERYDDERWK